MKTTIAAQGESEESAVFNEWPLAGTSVSSGPTVGNFLRNSAREPTHNAIPYNRLLIGDLGRPVSAPHVQPTLLGLLPASTIQVIFPKVISILLILNLYRNPNLPLHAPYYNVTFSGPRSSPSLSVDNT